MTDKLVKALEALKIIQLSPLINEDRKKEKMLHCINIADGMSNPSIRQASNLSHLLSISIETLLLLCDDSNSDVRMVADESLNRIIRAMSDTNIVKIQVELHKEIKKNGNARSLRAALWRFAELSHMIRPQKGKPYVSTLVPCIVQIAKRTEEPVLETLANALPKIFISLGNFTMDNDIKSLLKAFLHNLSSTSPVIRRTAANSIVAICTYCRKPSVFFSYILNTLMDCIVPIRDSTSNATVLGVLGCLRLLLPHLVESEHDSIDEIRGSFGVKSRQPISEPLVVDRMIQVYEVCFHFTNHSDHNVVNASLETLQQLLQFPPPGLLQVLLNERGILRSRIHASDQPEKLTHRSLSQMSVATSLSHGDENALLELEPVEKWAASLPPSGPETDLVEEDSRSQGSTLDDDVFQHLKIGQDMPESQQVSPTHSREGAISPHEPSLSSTDQIPPSCFSYTCELGSFTDPNVPLEFCARHLVGSFLIAPQSSKGVRVSVQALALGCLAAAVKLYPQLFVLSLDKHSQGTVQISDILSFMNHSDPQLRGLIHIFIGNLIQARLTQTQEEFNKWSKENKSAITLESLIQMLLKGLEDESSTCCRQALSGVGQCLNKLLESMDSRHALSILDALPRLKSNNYWLVKVKLMEVLSNLDYIAVAYVSSSESFQRRILDNVLPSLLADEDNRVRHSTAQSILKLTELLWFSSTREAWSARGAHLSRRYLGHLLLTPAQGLLEQNQMVSSSTPSPLDKALPYCRPITKTQPALSRLVHRLTQMLLTANSRHLTYGCIEALYLLSEAYPTTVYAQSWHCLLDMKFSKSLNVSPSTGLLSSAIVLMTSSPLTLELGCQQWLIQLAGNLFSGMAVSCLQNIETLPPEPSGQKTLWRMLKDPHLCLIAERLLCHIFRVLNVFTHVIDGIQPSTSSTRVTGLPHLSVSVSASALPSPIKRRTNSGSGADMRGVSPAKTDKDEESKMPRNNFGNIGGIPHYLRLYDLVKSSYSNYKMSLDSTTGEKFVGLLSTALSVLAQILEIATLQEAWRVAEDVLNCLKSTMTVAPIPTVACVHQLLKCLFGTNLTAQWDDTRRTNENDYEIDSSIDIPNGQFYIETFQRPYRCFVNYITTASNKPDREEGTRWMTDLKRKTKASAIFKSNADKSSLTSYIRLFEPMVIKSLKQYTVTSNVNLQCKVLQLLSQLVQLKVNYCLLDSDQIFIGFVLKQFEYIEEGQIPDAELLIPRIFQFLMHLSYEKYHSRSIITVPKVLQLCDGLMASGQSPTTHCIPALVPVVYDIFLVRGTSGGSVGTGGHGYEVAELDIQREVLLSMLLRLVHYPEVLDLLAVALAGARVAGGPPEACEEKWRRWSRQALDAVFAAARQFRLRLGERSAQRALFRLLAAAAPPRPMDPLLEALFAQPQDGSLGSLERWLGLCVAVWPTILSSGKEEPLLARLEEIAVQTPCLDGCLEPAQGLDPLNATNSLISQQLQLPPENLLARLVFRTIHVVVEQLHNLAFSSGEDDSINWHHFHELFSHFLLCCSHLFESGSYVKVTSSAISLLSEGHVDLNTINNLFLELAIRTPLLTCQWCHILGLLDYNEHGFWTLVLAPQRNENEEEKKTLPSLNIELLRIGGTMLFCDYMSENINDVEQLSWLLIEHITSVALLSEEKPVAELIAAVHSNATASGLLVQAIGTKCAKTLVKPSAICRVLRCLEGVHPEQSGSLLQLLVRSANSLTRGQPAPARRAAALARRAAEILLTLPQSSVHAQLTIEEVNALRDALLADNTQLKDSGFMSVLNKLCAQYYSLPPLEQPSGFNPAALRAITINKSWYLEQVKLRCSEEGSECAQLLSQLEYDDIVQVLSHVGFNLANLASCLTLGANLSLEMSQTREDPPATERILEAQLYKAARQATLDQVTNLREWIPKPHQVYSPGHQAAKYSRRLDQLFSDASFINKLFELAPAVRCLTITSRRLGQPLPTESLNHLAKFAILCLESCHWLSCETTFMPHRLAVALGCADTLLREPSLSIIIGQKASWVGSGAAALTALTQILLGNELLPTLEPKGLEKALTNSETSIAATASYQLAILVFWLEKTKCHLPGTPKFIAEPFRGLVISLSRTSLANSYVSTPPDAWRQGWTPELTGTWLTSVPALPVHYLQDLETLQQLVFRVQLLGWTSRQQFEEIWMGLLSVLSSYPAAGAAPDELSIMLQASNLAVQAITGLLIQTLYLPVPGNPNTSQFLHQPREKTPLASSPGSLKTIHERLAWALQGHGHDTHAHLGHVFARGNLERINNPNRYGLGQVSLEYLWTATSINTFRGSASLLCLKRNHALTTAGLDVHSCIHFLLDLYSQWTAPQSGTPLPLVTEAVRSLVTLSDLLTEPTQFQWMLATCLDLARSPLSEHELLSQYLVIAVCKSSAVLKPEPEILERVKKLVESCLRSGFLPSRLAGLHGMLYLIQTGTWDSAVDEFQQIISLAYEYLSKQLEQAAQDEHGLVMWALAFELLSRDSTPTNNESQTEPDFIQMALTLAPTGDTNLHLVMLQGLERLVVSKHLPKKYNTQVTKLAVERMRNSNPAHSFAALQLLISCMYTEHFSNPVDLDPEIVVQAIERTSAIFDRIKRGYPFEVEAVCSILPQMLTDLFPPSEILTKVIGEFLSPQQPHPKQLAAVVFQVFEQAWRQSQLPLIQDWVVFSLSNFTTCSTLGMAAWWLTCFFISASTNNWLRAVFPRVQTRIGRCDPEDSKLLCIAAADFYHQLTDKSQRQTFVAAFQAAARQPQTPFSDLIACL